MSSFPTPTVLWSGSNDAASPLVVLLHGRGSNETEIGSLVPHLPDGPSYAALRAPIQEGGGYAWFANRGIGRPLEDSLTETMAWCREWLDAQGDQSRDVVLVGFSGGAAFAGGLVLADPGRFKGAAILYGTLPFDAGVPTTPGRLEDVSVFVAQGQEDLVIPKELLERTWDYLTGDSGAVTTAIRHPGGHAIDPDTLEQLASWINGLTKDN